MIRTLALSAVAAMGIMLMPLQTTTSSAAPTIAPKIATPNSAVEQARRGGHSYGRSYSGRSYGRSFGGGRYVYGGRRFYGGRHYGHRHGRYHRRGYIYGAGIPFFYGGYGYYNGCGYYYRKWQRTGSRYWRNLYYSCRW
jgi:hypothetical protein